MTTPAPRIALVTLALNEAAWLESLYEQHRDWPGLVAWSFVESADPVYAATNPDRVSPGGLSVDGTGGILRAFRKLDDRVRYTAVPPVQFSDPAQGKCHARTLGLRAVDDAAPDFVFVLDADEFYTRANQAEMTDVMASPVHSDRTAFAFGLRSIWHPPCFADTLEPLLALEARGGVWSVPVCRGWRWVPGMEYRGNHNSPEAGGVSLAARMLKRWSPIGGVPECVHMGFAASPADRAAKHRYYEARGEGAEANPQLRANRAKYVACRLAWETWRPGRTGSDGLPPGCVVVPYNGPVPECFR